MQNAVHNIARQSGPSRLRYLRFVLIAIVFFAGGATAAQAADPPGRQLVGTVITVPSGDTMFVAARGRRYKVRLEAIAAPAEDEPAFEPARQALSAMTLGREVRIEALQETATLEWTGRVYVESTSINKQMLDEGWARYVEGERRYPVLARSEAAARQARRGMWRDDLQAMDADEDHAVADASDAEPGDDPSEPSSGNALSAESDGEGMELPHFPNYVPKSKPRDEGERKLNEVLDAIARKQQEVAGPLDGEKIDEQLAALAEVDFGALFSPQLLELADEHRDSPAAPWALLMVAQYEAGGTEASAGRLQQAYRRLVEQHGDAAPIGHALLALRHKPDNTLDKNAIYRQVIATSTQREARALACYLWATSLTEANRQVEARPLWQLAADELGDVKFGRHKLADIARKQLAALDEADEAPAEAAARSAAEAARAGDADEFAETM